MHENYQTWTSVIFIFSLSIWHNQARANIHILVQQNNAFYLDADVFLYLSISLKCLDANAPISISFAFPFRILNWIIKMYAVNRGPTGFHRNMRIFQKKWKRKINRKNWEMWRKRCVTIQNYFCYHLVLVRNRNKKQTGLKWTRKKHSTKKRISNIDLLRPLPQYISKDDIFF